VPGVEGGVAVGVARVARVARRDAQLGLRGPEREGTEGERQGVEDHKRVLDVPRGARPEEGGHHEGPVIEGDDTYGLTTCQERSRS
ncbi:hypothetical protein THAOC_15419, partial [Thalassiosira oceanica]